MKTTKLLTLALALLALPFLATAQLAPSNPPPAVTLAWDATSDSSVSSYRVYYGTASRSYTNYVVVPISRATVELTNLVRGATYYFAATCVATNGLESGFSNEVNYRVPTVPGAPANLRIITALLGTGEPWSVYALEQSAKPGGAWTQIAVMTANAEGKFIYFDETQPLANLKFYRAQSLASLSPAALKR